MDYLALDLSDAANAGLEAFGDNPAPPWGPALWHGLPFQLGGQDPAAPWLVALGDGGADSRSIAVGQHVTWVIFAHVLADAPREAPETLGKTVAEYEFVYATGPSLSVPIRDRFEVAGSSAPGSDPARISWGHLPFAAVTIERDHTPDRYEGRWEEAGGRRTETVHTWRAPLFLWPWRNPTPERRLERIELRARGRRLLVCAMTLSGLDEEPFPRDAAREVIVTLRDATDAALPFALEVDVDRGSAGYPFLISATAPEAFLADPLAGFGDEPNPGGSPAYVRISATPSATVSVRRDGVDLAAVNWGELQDRGRLDPTPALRLEVIDRGRNWVRTTVVDDETGQPRSLPHPLPLAEGRSLRAARPPRPRQLATSTPGTVDVGGDCASAGDLRLHRRRCEGWLPRGEVLVDVARGFEYEPLRRCVEIEPGQRELTLRLKRWRDMNARALYSAATPTSTSSRRRALSWRPRAEDLNVVNLLLSQWGHLFTNTEEFTGTPSVSRDGRHHRLRHAGEPPARAGPPHPAGADRAGDAVVLRRPGRGRDWAATLETTLSHWADACHEQGGTVVIPHLPTPNGEPAALIATGRADAVEMLRRLRLQPNGVLPLPQLRLPAAAGRRHRQDDAARCRSGCTAPTCIFPRPTSNTTRGAADYGLERRSSRAGPCCASASTAARPDPSCGCPAPAEPSRSRPRSARSSR